MYTENICWSSIVSQLNKLLVVDWNSTNVDPRWTDGVDSASEQYGLLESFESEICHLIVSVNIL